MTFGSEDACGAGDEVRGEGGGRGLGQASLLLVKAAGSEVRGGGGRRALGRALSPLCPNHVSLCHTVCKC